MKFEALPVSDDIFGLSILQDQLRQAVNSTLKDISSDFGKTVSSWNTEVTFNVKPASMQSSDLIGEIFSESKVYAYVNYGTKPHDIFPRNKRRLKFMSGYRAKTTPRVVGSHGGGPFGDDVFSTGVHHPGTEARKFDDEIAKRRQRTIENNVTAAILRANKAAQRGY